jgi:hypothetical protein
MFGDDDYPARTMGRAAEITGASQDFRRRLDEAKLVHPVPVGRRPPPLLPLPVTPRRIAQVTGDELAFELEPGDEEEDR